jgi:triosephosphate isomerase
MAIPKAQDRIVVANWKAEKTSKEIEEWAEAISSLTPQIIGLVEKEIVVCPSFTLLSDLKTAFKKHSLPFKLGVQNVSHFPPGAYTGEVTAQMLEEIVDYCIVGHSERRKHFGETNEQVVEKVNRLLEVNITPILCISDIAQLEFYINKGKGISEKSEDIIFVNEPPGNISGGTGKAYRPVTPEDVASSVVRMREIIGRDTRIIYGGSINPENAASLFSLPHVSGGLSGQASLDPVKFAKIIEQC